MKGIGTTIFGCHPVPSPIPARLKTLFIFTIYMYDRNTPDIKRAIAPRHLGKFCCSLQTIIGIMVIGKPQLP